ncbi:MAG TPA: family 20 glycosylhydrolase [Streptosporangiaceae bacterium]|nr:family 20 glycosylhydrolase [Streptosporangiaceae bacterium]
MDDRLAALLPQPRLVRPMPGQLALSIEPEVQPGRGDGADAAADAVRRALAVIPWPGAQPAGAAQQPGAAQPGRRVALDVHADAALTQEAYRLAVTPERVTIIAGGPAGAFYAVQTLRQLLPDDAWRSAAPRGAQWELPAAEIEDEPALTWRGMHIDVARHFFPKRELLALIEAAAALKLNRLHLHLTDDQGWRVESRRYPALHEVGSHRQRTRISLNAEQPPVYQDIPHGGYYTLADLAEITRFAADRMMTVVPEVELPGHSAALLAALPWLGAGPPPPGGYQVSADWGILPHLISPLPAARAALGEILAELVAATDAKYVHIGGDECVLDAWRADPLVDGYRRERGLATAGDLHAAFLRDIADTLAADFGARAVVWDEGFTSTAGQRLGLRDDTIVMAWRGMQIARAAADAGHDVVATPVFPTYFDYYQEREASEPLGIGGPVRIEDVAGFAPVPPDWPAGSRRRLLGTQFQVWTEYIPDGRALEYMIFPRGCALAEVAWTGGPALWNGADGQAQPGSPPLRGRVEAHLGRLAAAGIEFRPLSGPLPWQQGGTGPRRHRPGYPVQDVLAHLGQLAAGERL